MRKLGCSEKGEDMAIMSVISINNALTEMKAWVDFFFTVLTVFP